MKSKELKQYNLPEDRIILSQIDAKPNVILFAILFIGFGLVTLKSIIWGASMILVSFMGIVVLPKRVLIEFCYDYLILYNHANKTTCEIIYYEDVLKWKYVAGLGYDELRIKLVDDSVHKVDGFSKMLFETSMNRFLKDKKEYSKKTKK